jgi:hypothetical protein
MQRHCQDILLNIYQHNNINANQIIHIRIKALMLKHDDILVYM